MKYILSVLMVSCLYAQGNVITITAGTPPKLGGTINASATGSGTTNYYYWVSVNYPLGTAGISGPAFVRNAPSTLSVSDYIQVSWSAVNGASSYDVLRTSSSVSPTTGIDCNCAVIIGTTSISTTDIGSGLSSYTPALPIPIATAHITLDNQNYSTPELIFDTPTNIQGSGGAIYTSSSPISIDSVAHVISCPTCNTFTTGGGDVSGTFPNLTVIGLRGRSVSSNVPSDGNILAWVAADSAWEPSGTTSGVTAFNSRTGSVTPTAGDYNSSELADLTATYSTTTRVILSSTGTGNIILPGHGSTSFSGIFPINVDISSGSGTCLIYVGADASTAKVVEGSNCSLVTTCGANCTNIDSGVTSFDTLARNNGTVWPIATLSVTTGAYDGTVVDKRSFASAPLCPTNSGGITVTCSNAGVGLQLDTSYVLPLVSLSTTTPITVSTTANSGFYNNQNATAATAVTYNLPTASAGKQFCFTNSYNGSAADTGILTIQVSASGQYIIFTDGTLSASNGNVTSGGAAADAACVVGVDTTYWQLYVQRGTWAKH